MTHFQPPDGSLSLSETLDCGQTFRFRPIKTADGLDTWRGVAFGRTLTVTDTGDGFAFDCPPEEFHAVWFSYFDFGTDYAAIRRSLSALHPVLADAMRFAPGIRVLRQEPFEALIAFILSQNNNIARIKGIVERLCTRFGAPLSDGAFAFPTAERLAACDLEALRPLRAGFRAKYVLDAAQRVARGTLDLEALRVLPVDDAREALMTVSGIGPKVAECVLLYGLHRTECFPLDVWMRRAMTLFPGLSPTDFGPDAGIAQQYIFHYARMHPELF